MKLAPQREGRSALAGAGVVLPQAPAEEEKPKPYLTIRVRRGWARLELGEIWQFRDLLWALTGRDLKLRYKQTALGVLWVGLKALDWVFLEDLGKASREDVIKNVTANPALLFMPQFEAKNKQPAAPAAPKPAGGNR